MDAAAYPFGEDFQRKILALAVRGNLLRAAPGAFQARFFTMINAGRATPPRQRLAELIEHFAKQYHNERPGVITMDEMVRELARRTKVAERACLEEEWQIVRTLEVPDPAYVTDRTCQWAQDAAMAGAVLRAATLVEQARTQGRPVDRSRIVQTVGEAMAVGNPVLHGGMLLGEVVDRMAAWMEDPVMRKVSTGFPALDLALDGGPRYGEVFYAIAPPKGAKTTMQLNLALNALRGRYGVAYFSFEMGLNAMLMRMDRNIARATRKELRTGTKSLSVAVQALKAFGAKDVWVQRFYPQKHGCAEAARVIERLRADGHDVDVVFLDYLNIMSSEKREREKRHELVAISRDMSALAHELGVVVWTASLVGRNATDKPRPRKQDFWEAYEVVSVADGMVAICATPEMRAAKLRSLFLIAVRDAEDERLVGTYTVDMDRMVFQETEQQAHGQE